MFLSAIEREVNSQISILRSILRYIQTPEFQEFYNQYRDQEYLQRLIEQGNKDELRALFKEYQHGPLYGQTLRALRLQARVKGIESWYILTKPTLVRLLS